MHSKRAGLTPAILRHGYQRLFQPPEAGGFDWVGPLCILVLACASVLFIYSAQAYDGGNAWLRQMVFLGIGAGVYLLVGLIPYRKWLENAHLVYLAAIALLLAIFTPLGLEQFGARRWLDFRVITVQPTEAAKIALLLLVASILARSELRGMRQSVIVLGKVALATVVPVGLIFLQPDLGSALVFPPMVLALLFVSNLSLRFFMAAFVGVALLAGILAVDMIAYTRYLAEQELTPGENLRRIEQGEPGYQDHSLLPLRDYQRNRIVGHFAPDFVDPRGIGVTWNQRQSLIAVGSGGVLGKGHTRGTQAKLGYLPQSVAHNDFIFAVVAEESGFLRAGALILVFAVLIGNSFRIALLARDHFGRLLCVGVGVLFLIHTFINIGMTIGLTPITGLPLPFMSYGGSFVLSCCILQGLTQSVYRYRKVIH